MQHVDGLIDLPRDTVRFESKHRAGRGIDTADALRRCQPIHIGEILCIWKGQLAQVIDIDSLQGS